MCHNVQFKSVSGKRVSVCFGEYAYCTPRDNKGPFKEVEIGLWHHSPSLTEEHSDCGIKPEGELTVYPYTPIELLAKVLAE